MKFSRSLLALMAVIVVALVVVGVRLVIWSGQNSEGAKAVPSIGGPFQLTDHNGKAVSDRDFRNRYMLIFFGYTFCPDVCPTTLAESVAWKQKAGITDAELRTIFVTVDPERDTKDVLKEYLGGFDPDVIGLVGTPEQTEAAKASFGVMSEKDDSADKEFYLVNHTATVFLIGRNGEFEGTIAYGENTDTAVAKVEKLVKG